MSKTYVPLHVHTDTDSNLSMLDSTNQIKPYIKKCKEFGLLGTALTGHDSLSSLVQGWQECQEKKDEQGNIIEPAIKFIAGLEAYFCDDINVKDNTNRYSHLILLAKNDVGLQNLQELSTKAWLTGYYYKPRIDWNLLEEHKEGLIVTDACLGGVIKKKLQAFYVAKSKNQIELSNKIEKEIMQTIKRLISILGNENFYLEMQVNLIPEQIKINKNMVQLANHFNLKTIITTDIHYLRPEDKKLHEILLKSSFNNEREQEDFYNHTYLMTREGIEEIMFLQIGEEETTKALDNTIEIMKSIENYTIKIPPQLPDIKIPQYNFNDILKPYYDKYEYIKKFRYSDDENDKYWFYLIEKGYIEKKIFDYPNSEEYIERINTELWVFDSYKSSLNAIMSKYTNGVSVIFDIIRDECNSLISCGRGSSGAFFTNYLAHITELDPVKLNLPWWRFGHPERPDFFDIDFDSEANKKHLINKKIEDYFGKDNVIQLCTFGTISSKSAILATGRSLEIPLKISEKISSLIPVDRGKNRSIEKCLNGDEEEGFDPIPELIEYQKQYPTLFEYAIKLNGIIDKRSAHASGKIIFPEKYTKFNAAMKTSGGITVTQLNMDDSAVRGGIKYDFLTTVFQDKLHYCLNLIEKDSSYIRFENLDFNDKNIWENIFHNGNTDEIFQWSTNIGKNALKKLLPNTLKELSAGNSLIRLMSEGQESLIEKYIRYKNDFQEAIKDMRKAKLNEKEISIISKILHEKYGLCVTQEDFMVLSKEVAGFSVKQQNQLRKCIAKKKAQKEITEVLNVYKKQALEKGHRQVFIDYTISLILALKGYGFSDIHADEYSVEGWKSAKLKQYHPIEWQCACLNVNADALDEIEEDLEDDSEQKKKAAKYFKIGKAIAEFQESGNKVYPPDVNKAKREFSIIDNKIIFGLKGLVHVGDEAIAQIVNNRPYTDIKDFYKKNCWRGSKNNPNAVSKPAILSLIKCGAFDFYNPNRKEVLGEYIQFARTSLKEKRETLDFSINDYQPMSKKDYETMIETLKEYNRYQWEFDSTNYFFSGTPFDILKKIGIAIYHPKYMPEKEEIIVYGTVLGKEDRPEKKYVYIVTAKGILKLRVYLDKWNQYKDLLQRGTSVIVKGVYRFEALTAYEIKDYFGWINNLKNNSSLSPK